MTELTQEDAVQRTVQATLDLYGGLDPEHRESWAVKAAVDEAEEALVRASARFDAEPGGDLATARKAWAVLAQAVFDQIKGRVMQ